jgi:zinc transport system substrate-binding protein
VSPKVATTLAADLGVDARVLDPLEGVADPSQDYFSIAEANLSALKMALSCS